MISYLIPMADYAYNALLILIGAIGVGLFLAFAALCLFIVVGLMISPILILHHYFPDKKNNAITSDNNTALLIITACISPLLAIVLFFSQKKK